MAKVNYPLDWGEVAKLAGYSHDYIRKSSTDLQRWGYVKATRGGFVLTEVGRAVITRP